MPEWPAPFRPALRGVGPELQRSQLHYYDSVIELCRSAWSNGEVTNSRIGSRITAVQLHCTVQAPWDSELGRTGGAPHHSLGFQAGFRHRGMIRADLGIAAWHCMVCCRHVQNIIKTSAMQQRMSVLRLIHCLRMPVTYWSIKPPFDLYLAEEKWLHAAKFGVIAFRLKSWVS